MFRWMVKNLMTNDTYDSRGAGLLHSAVQIKSPWRHMFRIISSNRTLRAYTHWSPRHINDNLNSKVAQITNKVMFIFGRYHTSSNVVFKDCESDMAERNLKAAWSDSRDSPKLCCSTAECGFLNFDSRATSKKSDLWDIACKFVELYSRTYWKDWRCKTQFINNAMQFIAV